MTLNDERMPMIVRCFWPACDFRHKQWDARPIDAFWVEATHEEVIQSVLPMLSHELQLESEQLGARGKHMAEQISQLPRPFCFLVARDLSSIDPFEVHYPFHNFWGAFSPFRSIPERTITSLQELAGISVEVGP
jgi:hypothetical protein